MLWTDFAAAVASLWTGFAAAGALLWTDFAAAVVTLWTNLPHLVEQTRKSTVSTISEPWHLAVFYSALLVLACYKNWEEAKNIFANVFDVVTEVAKAVWTVFSDPERLVYYALFVMIVRTTPEVIANLSASMLKSAKLQ